MSRLERVLSVIVPGAAVLCVALVLGEVSCLVFVNNVNLAGITDEQHAQVLRGDKDDWAVPLDVGVAVTATVAITGAAVQYRLRDRGGDL